MKYHEYEWLLQDVDDDDNDLVVSVPLLTVANWYDNELYNSHASCEEIHEWY